MYIAPKAMWNKTGYFSVFRVKKFAATMYHLLKESDFKIDLIIGAGNSGAQMIGLTKIILKELNIKIPLIETPVYRYKPYKDGRDRYEGRESDKFDNYALINHVKNELINNSIKTVLFVDDEIGGGNAAKATLDLIIKVNGNKKLTYIITAEDHEFLKNCKWMRKYPNVNFKYYPFDKEINGLYTIIAYNVPYSMREEILKFISKDKLEDRLHMNFLLGEPVKKLVNDKPVFTHEYEELLKNKIKDFIEMQKEYTKYVNDLMLKGISEYKKGKIKPYFLKSKRSCML